MYTHIHKYIIACLPKYKIVYIYTYIQTHACFPTYIHMDVA